MFSSPKLQVFPYELQKRLEWSAILGKIMHLVYLVVKHSRNNISRYNSIYELFRNSELLYEAVRKEGKEIYRDEYALKKLRHLIRYLNVLPPEALEPVEVAWRLMLSTAERSRILAHAILTVRSKSPHGIDSISINHFFYDAPMLCWKISGVSLLPLEYEVGGELTKLLVYIGRIYCRYPWHSSLAARVGLCVRLSLNNEDARNLLYIQQHQRIAVVKEDRPLQLYLPLLRLRRTPYRVFAQEENFNEERISLLSETLITDKEYDMLVSGDFRANILLTPPSPFLDDALCLLATVRGRLEGPLISGRAAAVLDNGSRITVWQFGNHSALSPEYYRPGEYMILALIPILAPEHIIMLGAWSCDTLGEVNKSERGVERLSNLFPRLGELRDAFEKCDKLDLDELLKFISRYHKISYVERDGNSAVFNIHTVECVRVFDSGIVRATSDDVAEEITEMIRMYRSSLRSRTEAYREREQSARREVERRMNEFNWDELIPNGFCLDPRFSKLKRIVSSVEFRGCSSCGHVLQYHVPKDRRCFSFVEQNYKNA